MFEWNDWKNRTPSKSGLSARNGEGEENSFNRRTLKTRQEAPIERMSHRQVREHSGETYQGTDGIERNLCVPCDGNSLEVTEASFIFSVMGLLPRRAGVVREIVLDYCNYLFVSEKRGPVHFLAFGDKKVMFSLSFIL